jgi:hypothetical protein
VWLEPTLLRDSKGKTDGRKQSLPTSQPAELNTSQALFSQASARFFYQSPGPCLTPCSVNRSLVDLIGPRTRESPAREDGKDRDIKQYSLFGKRISHRIPDISYLLEKESRISHIEDTCPWPVLS